MRRLKVFRPLLVALASPALVLVGSMFGFAGALASDLYSETYGKLDVHLDHYWRSPAFNDQKTGFVITDFKPGLLVEQDGQLGSYQLIFEPRISTGSNGAGRVDLTEANVSLRGEEFDLLVGNSIEFWGKAESYNPVDIINSYDHSRGFSRGQKLGAPMLKLSMPVGPGQLDLYALPWFVENIYPGNKSRLRLPLPVANDHATYSNGAKRSEIGHAVRWSGYFGDLDIGVSHFAGISSQARLVAGADGRFTPDYGRISQTGLDAQYLLGDSALKAEMIYRKGQFDRLGVIQAYHAGIIGGEHNLYGVLASEYDAVLFVEFAHDDRDKASHTGFQNDLVSGVRLLFNDVDDSEAMVVVARDLDYRANTTTMSYNTRISDNLVIKASIGVKAGLERDLNNSAFEKDSHFSLTLGYSW